MALFMRYLILKKGNFLNDKLHGHGIFTDADGIIYDV